MWCSLPGPEGTWHGAHGGSGRARHKKEYHHHGCSCIMLYVCVMSSKVSRNLHKYFYLTVQHVFSVKSGAVFVANTAQRDKTNVQGLNIHTVRVGGLMTG